MMTVKELSKQTGICPDTIRYYTKIGLLIPERHPVNKYKLFTRYHIKLLEFIRRAKSLGLSLDDIQNILNDARKNHSPDQRVRITVRQRLAENDSKIRELTDQQQRIKQALRMWEQMPDALPQGDSFCHLIEAIPE